MCCSPAFVADIVLDDDDKKGGGEENNGDAKVKENRTLHIRARDSHTYTLQSFMYPEKQNSSFFISVFSWISSGRIVIKVGEFKEADGLND